MKLYRDLLRAVAILLSAVLLLGCAVYAEDSTPADPVGVQTSPAEEAPAEEPPAEEPPAEEPLAEEPPPTDEELCAQYQIADNWARPALLFAVRAGLLRGRKNGLDPKAGITRAEVASVLMRMLNTQSRVNLKDTFRDVNPESWYYDDLCRANALGIITGTSNNTMAPNAKITREQAFVMLSRVFAIKGKGYQSIYQYSDWANVGGFAQVRLAAMIDAGYVKGSGGKLRPKGEITRQEFAQVIYNLVRGIGDEVPNDFSGSYVLRADTVPEGTVIDGDLLLVNEAHEIMLKNVTVTGKLIVQGKGYLYLTLTDCSVGDLVLCRNTELYTDRWLPRVQAIGALKFNRGEAGELRCWYGSATVGAYATVDNVLALEQTDITVNGTVKRLEINSSNVSVSGSGKLVELRILKGGETVNIKAEKRWREVDPGLASIIMTRTDELCPTVANPRIKVNVKLTNVPKGEKLCAAQWLIEGKAVSDPFVVRLKEGMTLSGSVDFKDWLLSYLGKSTVSVQLALNLDGEKATRSVQYSIADVFLVEARSIHPMNVMGTISYNTSLYSSSSLGGYITSVPKGTYVTYIGYSGTSAANIILPNGTRGWVPYSAVAVWSDKFYVTWDYSTPVKECYVNQVKQASSKSNYLIWVSTYTQRVNIFYGSKGNWKLIQTFNCATGKNTTPTKIQDTVIQYKTRQWNFDDFYVHSVSNLDSAGRAFHSRPKYYGSGNVYDWTMGCPVSHGCIRMMDDGVNYIYDNVPVGTTVIIY